MSSNEFGLYGVQVSTWGTKSTNSNGFDNFMDQELFGGNVGHASINMKLPINNETKLMIVNQHPKLTPFNPKSASKIDPP